MALGYNRRCPALEDISNELMTLNSYTAKLNFSF